MPFGVNGLSRVSRPFTPRDGLKKLLMHKVCTNSLRESHGYNQLKRGLMKDWLGDEESNLVAPLPVTV